MWFRGAQRSANRRERERQIERGLWKFAGQALDEAPIASAPRLYVESLNEMIDGETARVAALPTGFRPPSWCSRSWAAALGLLGAYLAIFGRGVFAVLLASALVAFLLLVTADLDRPTRGMIEVPDKVLRDELESMEEPPAAAVRQ